jgi:transcriptional regulator with XRE-family HTH domain
MGKKTKVISHTLSSDIVHYLQDEGKTLKEIGILMGLSESYISYVKSGSHKFTETRLKKLEKSLGKPLPLILLQAVNKQKIPKELKPQYEALKKILITSSNF